MNSHCGSSDDGVSFPCAIQFIFTHSMIFCTLQKLDCYFFFVVLLNHSFPGSDIVENTENKYVKYLYELANNCIVVMFTTPVQATSNADS